MEKIQHVEALVEGWWRGRYQHLEGLKYQPKKLKLNS